jgi:AbrB family looped-hinge helix DNA binding protein
MGKALGASKVTVRYQVTVPEDARKKLRVKEGDTLVFYEAEGKVYITTEI